jgi:heme/copper-type cytochrome/quinol oxidase subunit 4
MRVNVVVWIGLMLLVVVEVALTYAHLATPALLAGLLSLAVIEAGIALLYFMHLRYERPLLFWSLIPTLVFTLVMMDHFWPDALRLFRLRLGAP